MSSKLQSNVRQALGVCNELALFMCSTIYWHRLLIMNSLCKKKILKKSQFCMNQKLTFNSVKLLMALISYILYN